jgi:hypothetical protein
MRASPTGLALALLTTVIAAGIASAQSSYPCTETNANLPNPYRQVADWVSASKNPNCPIVPTRESCCHNSDSHKSAEVAIFRGAL